MKRLTIRNGDGSVSQLYGVTVEEVFYRLAEYEDTGLEPDEIKDNMDMLHAYRHVCAGYEPEHIRELLQSRAGGRMVVQKAVPGSQVWIMERDECGDPYDISGYMFFASIGNAVIVSPFLSGIKDLEETLDYYIEITAEEYSSDLAAFPNEDCYLTREEAEAALAKKGCNQ